MRPAAREATDIAGGLSDANIGLIGAIETVIAGDGFIFRFKIVVQMFFSSRSRALAESDSSFKFSTRCSKTRSSIFLRDKSSRLSLGTVLSSGTGFVTPLDATYVSTQLDEPTFVVQSYCW